MQWNRGNKMTDRGAHPVWAAHKFSWSILFTCQPNWNCQAPGKYDISWHWAPVAPSLAQEVTKKPQTHSGSLHPLQEFGSPFLSSFPEKKKNSEVLWFYLRSPIKRPLISHRERGSHIHNKKLTTRPHTFFCSTPSVQGGTRGNGDGIRWSGHKWTNTLKSWGNGPMWYLFF